MKNKFRIWTIAVGIIIGGISYWFQPYNQLYTDVSQIKLIWSLGTFIEALLLAFILNEKPFIIAVFVFLGVIFAVIARIFYDITFMDKTSHNLFPFDIVLCGIITFPSAFAGVYLAVLVKKIKK
ncbi:hypothetical protein [Tamlana flava]|uniref:hypothetical protein n=1 Tax=Tamlana flava TaxID=3158572 RepID=UPI00351AE8C0